MTLKLHLSIDFLHKLYDDVFKINDEVCGYLQMSDDKLTMYNKKKGERDEKGRGSCSLPEKIAGSQTDYIFHTHPENSYAYPSFQDLWYVMKRRNVYSFIMTIWGLFVVVPRGTIAINDEKTRDDYEKIFKYNITEFHKNTKRGSHVSKSYNDSISEITHFINIVNKLFGEKRRRSKSPTRSSPKRSRSNDDQIDSLGCHLYMYLYSWEDIACEKVNKKKFIEIET
jgi:hypothetical protein